MSNNLKFPLREAWAKSFVLYPQSKAEKMMKIDERGDIAVFVSGELFKVDSLSDQFQARSPIYHVWIGDKWAYCGPSVNDAYATFDKSCREKEQLTN